MNKKNKNIDLLELEYKLSLDKISHDKMYNLDVSDLDKYISDLDKECNQIIDAIFLKAYYDHFGIVKNANIQKEISLYKEALGFGQVGQVGQTARNLWQNRGTARKAVGLGRSAINRLTGGDSTEDINAWKTAYKEATDDSKLSSIIQQGKKPTAKPPGVDASDVTKGIGEATETAAKGAGEVAETAAKGAGEIAETAAKGTGVAADVAGAAAKPAAKSFFSSIPGIGDAISLATAAYNAYNAIKIVTMSQSVKKEVDDAVSKQQAKTRGAPNLNFSSKLWITPKQIQDAADIYRKSPIVLGKLGKLAMHYEFLARYCVGFLGDLVNSIDGILGIAGSAFTGGASAAASVASSAAITVITELGKAYFANMYFSIRNDTILKYISKKGKGAKIRRAEEEQQTRRSSNPSAPIKKIASKDYVTYNMKENRRPIIKSGR